MNNKIKKSSLYYKMSTIVIITLDAQSNLTELTNIISKIIPDLF